MEKWVVIGIKEGWVSVAGGMKSWRWNRYEIATFDTKEMAQEYIEKSRLKSGKFGRKSLLYGYNRVIIEYKEISNLPHNPKK